MLQRDLIMRVIQMFFEALAKFLRNKEGKSQDVLRLEIEDLYKTFLKHSRQDFHEMSVEEIVASFNDDERIFKNGNRCRTPLSGCFDRRGGRPRVADKGFGII